MSAIPPKADIARRQLDVRFVPFPDQGQRSKARRLFDQLISAVEQLRRDAEAERFCGL
jgi:hypothetical protein